ncbi:hypothetical protein [Ascidiaceihabitans sp.]|uniref:hypothetical protein n=1 Tax=Ascidiaceihabitans sp. TaxID=1872644 RepID=UPI003296F066
MQLASYISKTVNPILGAFKRATPHIDEDGVVVPHTHVRPKRVAARQNQTPTQNDTDALVIPCPDPTAEDRERDFHQMRGQRLARQENWHDISSAIRLADRSLSKTSGGMPVADLISYGARADVVQACEHALLSGKPAKGAPILAGIEALEEVLAECGQDYIIAVIVAHAHMDIAWAWRGTCWDAEVCQRNKEAFQAHFDRARDILEPFQSLTPKPAFLAAAECALRGGCPDGKLKIADAYQQLIDLDPENARAMRAMGNHLLPRWFGDYNQLELEARRTASRTQSTWGAGAYTWVQLDAIAFDDEACARLDVSFFVDGLRDILERTNNQYIVNLTAAYCANTMGNARGGHDEADQVRSQIADCAKWIIREHLTELHPMIWAHAARGFDNSLRVRCPDRFAAAGQADALRIIGNLFRPDIAAGRKVVFTEDGPVTRPA